MENNKMACDMETTKNLINELTQGRDFAHQLQFHLRSSSSSPGTLEFLAQKILSSYQNSISILSSGDSQKAMAVESPDSRSGGSPMSEDSDQELKDASKKRKKMLRWKKQVKLNPGIGLEGQLDDGFSWRKYGQKDILGAKFPRGYYRCTHKHGQGCQATKQVQKSDDDPTILEITYCGRHTCAQASNAKLVNPLTENQEPINNFGIGQNQGNEDLKVPQELTDLRKELHVITQDLEVQGPNHNLDSFYFPSSSATRPEKSEFMTHLVDSNSMLLESFASGANYGFSVSPSFSSTNFTSSPAHFGNSEPEFAHETMSAAASATNSPTVGFDFPFGNMGFDSTFTFGNPGGSSS